jgi:hypothetical protein
MHIKTDPVSVVYNECSSSNRFVEPESEQALNQNTLEFAV